MSDPVYFFGCWRPGEPQHHLFAPDGFFTKMAMVGDMPITGLYGGCQPADAQQDETALVLKTTPQLTILGCWDRSVDARLGSCAAFVAHGRHSVIGMIAMAKTYFPVQARRLKSFQAFEAAQTQAVGGQEMPPDVLNPWMPEQDPVRLAVFGKLSEELAELTAIVSRCQIQGVEEAEPVTNKPNRDALEEEIGDVLAGIEIAMQDFALSREAIDRRKAKKIAHLRRWHGLIRAAKSLAGSGVSA